MSLTVLGDRLEEVGRGEEAAGARTVSPSTRSHPISSRGRPVFAGPMMSYIRDYLRRAEAAGIETDEALVAPIFAILVPKMEGAKE